MRTLLTDVYNSRDETKKSATNGANLNIVIFYIDCPMQSLETHKLK